MVRPHDHAAYHRIAGNMLPNELAAMLTDVYIDPAYYLVAIPRKNKKSAPKRQGMYCVDCQAEVLKHLPITHKGE
jgi:hypothetical protein